MDVCLAEAVGRSSLRMNCRTWRSANCCRTRGRSSLRMASLRRRTSQGADVRSSWGRGEWSSRPCPLSTSFQRSCARSPRTRTQAVYSPHWPLSSRSSGARTASASTSAEMLPWSPASCRSSICRAKLKKRRSAKPSRLGSSGMIIRPPPRFQAPMQARAARVVRSPAHGRPTGAANIGFERRSRWYQSS